ncbi:MAG TPA: serine hydrolase domain-containing protein [Microlunatus sp.]
MSGATEPLDLTATLETIDRWVAYRVWHSRLPGAQVAIGRGGRVELSRAYGFADAEQRIPMRTDHLFRIASHSKTFTATAVLQLVEAGRIGLEDRIADLVPELGGDAIGQASVRELLEHTSGALRDGLDGDFWQGHRDFPDREELLAAVRVTPKTGPGEEFAYSNLGYGLLGLAIESVTSMSYVEAMAALIIAPLGLTATAACHQPDRVDDYAAGHSGLHTAHRRSLLTSVDTRALDAATGFTSTATDLVSYFSAHTFGDSRLLSDRFKRLMQRRANPTDRRKPQGGWYGLGMDGESFDEHRMAGHGGGYPGHSTRTLLDPETGLVVSVMTNAIDGPAAALASGILTLLDDAREHPTADDENDLERRGLGRWRNLWAAIDLGIVGGRVRSIQLPSWDPLDGADVLEPTADGYRIIEGNGYGSLGERIEVSADLLRYGSMSYERFDDLPDSPA